MNVIPCATWVKKGVAAAEPDKVELTPQELESIIKQAQSNLRDEEESNSDSDEETQCRSKKTKKQGSKSTEEESMKDDEFNFDNYDEEDGNIHCNIGGLAVINQDGKDPFVTVAEEDAEDSEKEDDIIKPDDNLVILGHVEGDASILEIFVYNENEGSFYCHHDILLPSFPLCLEWINYDPLNSKPANFCVVGNMTPIIDVWDLDIIDCLEPAFQLGRKPSKKKKLKRIGHKDAVLDVAWNTNYIHILASGSVDQTVLLWDLENCTPATKLSSFEEKVQSLKWHPVESHQLLTGCADKMIRLFDSRTENNFKTWQASGEVERVLWNHFDPNYFLFSTDTGYVECCDVRENKAIWSFQVHEKEVTGLSLSSYCPGFLVTSSNDGVVKVWDIIDCKNPDKVWESKTNLGALQCLSSNPDHPFTFAVGGDNKSHNFKIFDFLTITEVSDKFKGREILRPHKVETQSEMMEVTQDMNSMFLNSAEKSHKKRKYKREFVDDTE